MIRGAVFDVDGTLLDSMSVWDTLGETYLRSLGYEPRENLNEVFKNMSLYQAACYYQKEYGVSLSTDAIMEGVNAMISDYYKDQAQLKPHAADFLSQLRKRNVRMCIATATDKPFIEAALSRCGVIGYFSEILTCTLVGSGKDEPAIYREALRHLSTSKSDTVIFEDALYAVETAKKDGFFVTAVYDQHEKAWEKVLSLADCAIPDFSHTDSFWKFIENM